MKVAQTNKPGGNFELVEREIPQPAAACARATEQLRLIVKEETYLEFKGRRRR